MASVNKWIGIGNVGADPEVRYMPNGDAVANVRLACSESWKDKTTGEKKEVTEWVRVVFYRKLAEVVSQYVKKGSALYVEGRIRTRKWQDKEGQERYTTEIEASEMQMLGSRGGDTGNNQAPAEGRPHPADRGRQNPGSAPKPGGFDDMDDDIPF